MTRWRPRILARIVTLASARRVQITNKTRREIEALDLELGSDDVCDLLAALSANDFSRRIASEMTGEWLYVFKPQLLGMTLYLKLIVREDCIVVSFHEDETDESDETNEGKSDETETETETGDSEGEEGDGDGDSGKGK